MIDLYEDGVGRIGFDASGKTHIVTVDFGPNPNQMLYATNTSGSFVTTDLNDAMGLAPTDEIFALRVATFGSTVHIAFTRYTYEYNIYYSENSGGSFSPAQLVADINGTDQEPDIDVDSFGVVHIAHHHWDGVASYVNHSENSLGNFASEMVTTGAHPHIAIGPANEVGITSHDINSDIYFSSNSSGSFVTKRVSTSMANQSNSLAIGGNSYAHIVTTDLSLGSEINNHAVAYYTNNPNFEPGGGQSAGKMYIERIDMSAKKKGPRWNAVADVLILDQSGSPVQDASVSGDWSGIVSGSSSASTDAQGVATLNSPKTKSSGTITVTVTNVAKSGLSYDPAANEETFDSITGPPLAKTVAENVESEIPTGFALLSNFPNPFNPETTIRFSVPKSSQVQITIYNMLGKVIRRLVSKEYSAGEHTIISIKIIFFTSFF